MVEIRSITSSEVFDTKNQSKLCRLFWDHLQDVDRCYVELMEAQSWIQLLIGAKLGNLKWQTRQNFPPNLL